MGEIPDIVRVEGEKYFPDQESISFIISDPKEVETLFYDAHEWTGHGHYVIDPDLSQKPYYIVKFIDESGMVFVSMKVCEDCILVEIDDSPSWEDDSEGKLWNMLEQGVNHG